MFMHLIFNFWNMVNFYDRFSSSVHQFSLCLGISFSGFSISMYGVFFWNFSIFRGAHSIHLSNFSFKEIRCKFSIKSFWGDVKDNIAKKTWKAITKELFFCFRSWCTQRISIFFIRFLDKNLFLIHHHYSNRFISHLHCMIFRIYSVF